MLRLVLAGPFLCAAGGLGLAGHFAAYPYRTTVAIAELTRDGDGFLVGDFLRPWPFKPDKNDLDQIVVMHPDGTELERVASRAGLAVVPSGFLVNGPAIVFRLDGAAQIDPG